MESSQVPGHVVNFHFGSLKVVEFLSDGGLVPGRESRPGFVCVPIVVNGFGDFDVIVEPNNSFLLELFDGGSKREFPRERLFHFLALPPSAIEILVGSGPEDIALFEFFSGRAKGKTPVESDADETAIVTPHFLRYRDENVAFEKLLLARTLAQETRQAFFAYHFGGQTTSVVVAVVVAIFQRIVKKVIRQKMNDVFLVIYVDFAEIEKAGHLLDLTLPRVL